MRASRASAARWMARAAMTLALLAFDARAQTMTFVMDPFPPFTYEEDGNAAGPMSDTIRAVCAELKWQCTLEVYPWRRALKLAEDGLVDGIYAIADIPERRRFLLRHAADHRVGLRVVRTPRVAAHLHPGE